MLSIFLPGPNSNCKLKKTIFVIAGGLACAVISYAWYFPLYPLQDEVRIDSLVLRKADRKLEGYSNGLLIKSYRVALGSSPAGKKEVEGDNKTPEGKYFITSKSAISRYHKNLHVSYPSADDVLHASVLGKNAGGQIKIHGLPEGYRLFSRFHVFRDWTQGCIAVTNDEIDELFRTVHPPVPILCLP